MRGEAPRSIVEKIWRAHAMADAGGGETLLHLDRVFLHERTGPALLSALAAAGRRPAIRAQVLALVDHAVETTPGRVARAAANPFVKGLREGTGAAGIALVDLDDPRQGIVHVVTPEQGFVLPGMTVVCPDSHTGTVGGLGALAWGIGSTEGEHAVATQSLVRAWPGQARIDCHGRLPEGVTAKDLALALLARFGAEGGAGRAIEYAGEAVRALGVEGRLTLCNLAVEFGAWTGIVAPDDTTFRWIAGRPEAPAARAFDEAVAHWRTLASDEGAAWDAVMDFDASGVAPMLTWGTSPAQAIAVDGRVPDPSGLAGAARAAAERALAYMDLVPGAPIEGTPIDAAFIGSCTNSRLPDLRDAAAILRGRRVAPGVKAIVVPGSSTVKRDAEAEGLDRVFREAGFEWRESGCSLCFFAGIDSFGGARRVVTSTNRNFEGRQGPGVRSHLASPATVAASAVAGCLADPRKAVR